MHFDTNDLHGLTCRQAKIIINIIIIDSPCINRDIFCLYLGYSYSPIQGGRWRWADVWKWWSHLLCRIRRPRRTGNTLWQLCIIYHSFRKDFIFQIKVDIFLHISTQKYILWYSLEASHRGASNESPQYMFLGVTRIFTSCIHLYSMHTLGNIIVSDFSPAGLSGSVGCAPVWWSGGCWFDPCWVGSILPWRLIVKYFLQSFSPFCWFKVGGCQFMAKECAQYWLTA